MTRSRVRQRRRRIIGWLGLGLTGAGILLYRPLPWIAVPCLLIGIQLLIYWPFMGRT